jgi:NADPH2:quinone reductase
MKAIRVTQFGGPEVLKLEEVPDLTPGPDQIVVAVKAVGVNPVDTYIRSGNYAMKPSLPYTPGADGAGLVLAVGHSYDPALQLKVGARVYFFGSHSGSYAEQSLISDNNVYPLPDQFTFSQGAALGVPYATAYRALFDRGGAEEKDIVLIHGASGGVGIAAVQLAKRAGLTVIGTAGTEKGRHLVRSEGADHILDHHDPSFGEKLAQITNGKGVDVIIEFMAHLNLGKDLTYLSKWGRVVVVGSRGPVEINPRDAMSKDADIRAMTLFNASTADLSVIHTQLGEGLRDGSLNPVIGREFPLAEASKAHEAILMPGAHGKIILIP